MAGVLQVQWRLHPTDTFSVHAMQVVEGSPGTEELTKSKAWRWRELVARIASGAEASADISTAWWAGAVDLPGPNFPCPIGFQVIDLTVFRACLSPLTHLECEPDDPMKRACYSKHCMMRGNVEVALLRVCTA